MINLATVGTSNIANNFLDACMITGKFRLSAVYSREENRGVSFAKKYGCGKVYTDLEKMARDTETDAVYIASPNLFHYSQSKIFLENGKHVICEKPIATSLSEYVELKKIADKNNLIYMEAIMSQNSFSRQIVKDAVCKIGNISMARINFCQLSSRYEDYLLGKHINIFDMSLRAGTLMDIGVYCVYVAVDLFGMPKEIVSKASYLRNGADSAGVTLFCYDNFNAVLSYSKIGQSFSPSEIVGDKGTLKIDSVSQYNGISIVENNEERVLYSQPIKPMVMSGECNNFADFISDFPANKEKYDELSNTAYNVHMCMDKIKQSANIKYNQEDTL